MERKKILIIEDNPMNMQLAADLLELGGYAVLKAETAEAGIHLAETQSPDLILMDISLPGMNGLEAAAVLKKKTGTDKIPIVALRPMP